jgi:hypothetical protein
MQKKMLILGSSVGKYKEDASAPLVSSLVTLSEA